MCEKPVLANPDLKKTFYLQTDTSTSGAGAVLSQELDDSKKRRPIAYFSCIYSPAEANYNIYEKEFLAVIKAIQNWRAHLIWMEKLFIIKTDHKNLTYWKEHKRLSGHTVRWHKKLQDYNFKIVHVAGKDNGPADTLSRMHQDEEREEPRLTPLLPPDVFLNVFEAGDLGTIEHDVVMAQQKHTRMMKQWEKMISIVPSKGPHMMEWRDKEGQLIVPPDNALKRKILRQLHDHWGAGHPGRDETIRRVQRQYF